MNGLRLGSVRVGLLALALAVSADVTSAGFSARLEAVSDAALGNPHDIKLSADRSQLYVSDVDNDRVAILDAKTLRMVSSFGAGEQNGTHDVDVGPDGRLYVADTHNHRIAIYALTNGKASLEGELRERLGAPEGVLVHPNGRVYATGAGTGNIVAYEGGRVVAERGGLSAPHDVEVTPDGDLWIADAGNDRLVRMSPDLEVQGTLEGATYAFRGPRYLDITTNGILIVADKYTHSVKIIDAKGALLATFTGGEAGRLRTPEGIELDGDTLWIADSGNDRILRYRFRIETE